MRQFSNESRSRSMQSELRLSASFLKKNVGITRFVVGSAKPWSAGFSRHVTNVVDAKLSWPELVVEARSGRTFCRLKRFATMFFAGRLKPALHKSR